MSTFNTSRQPIVDDEAFNAEANCGNLYVDNSPTNYTDPSGLQSQGPIYPGGPIITDGNGNIIYPIWPPAPGVVNIPDLIDTGEPSPCGCPTGHGSSTSPPKPIPPIGGGTTALKRFLESQLAKYLKDHAGPSVYPQIPPGSTCYQTHINVQWHDGKPTGFTITTTW